jgi:hypothetical protein
VRNRKRRLETVVRYEATARKLLTWDSAITALHVSVDKIVATLVEDPGPRARALAPMTRGGTKTQAMTAAVDERDRHRTAYFGKLLA